MHHAGRIVSRGEIVDHLYEQDFDRDFEYDRGLRAADCAKSSASTSSRPRAASATSSSPLPSPLMPRRRERAYAERRARPAGSDADAKALNARSIASRLFLSAAFWSSSILIIAGLGLSALNARSTDQFDDELGVYLKALVANVAVAGEEGRAAPPVIAPQFELAFSGWYWQITRLDGERPDIRTSRSLFGNPVASTRRKRRARHLNRWRGYVTGPGDRPLRMIEREIDRRRRPLPRAGRRERRRDSDRDREFRICPRRYFLALAPALLGSTALAVRFGLRPLRS